jgi:hypothetical protein
MSIRASILCACLVVTGCMPFRFYPLPVSAADARATFAPIATAASNLGYRFYQHPDRVIVEPDARARIDFMFDASGNYSMCVMIKEKNPPGGVERAIAEARAKGDDLWSRAMARLPAAASTTTLIVPPPPARIEVNIGRGAP